MSTESKKYMRSFFRATGVVQTFFGALWAYQWMMAGLAGEIAIGWSLLFAFICVGLVSGGGLLFVFLDPQKVIQTDTMNVFRLVKPYRVPRQTFADRIGVDEDDE